MLSGRVWMALGLLGVGAYVLRRGTDVASSVHGLGDDAPVPATPEQAAALNAQLAAAQARIQTINQLLVITPPMPRIGPRPMVPA